MERRSGNTGKFKSIGKIKGKKNFQRVVQKIEKIIEHHIAEPATSS